MLRRAQHQVKQAFACERLDVPPATPGNVATRMRFRRDGLHGNLAPLPVMMRAHAQEICSPGLFRPAMHHNTIRRGQSEARGRLLHTKPATITASAWRIAQPGDPCPVASACDAPPQLTITLYAGVSRQIDIDASPLLLI